MKQIYQQPEITLIAVFDEDILTSSFEVGEELIPSNNQE